MDDILDLDKVARGKTHWDDKNSPNPCAAEFVKYCIEHFSVGRALDGETDTYGRFHDWVNEQAFPGAIPEELTRQMWKRYERRRNGLRNVPRMKKGMRSM